MAILPFLAIYLMLREGCIYSIAAYFYAFRLAFSTISPCVLHQNALHLAAFCTIFSRKKPKSWCKWRSLGIDIHFASFAD